AAIDRAEQMRVACQHIADEQAAVAAAQAGEALAPRNATRDQILRHGREVVMRELFAFAHAGLVPGGPELAAAADGGDHMDATPFQPLLADAERIVRQARDLKAAIAAEQAGAGAIERKTGLRDLKIGNARAVE